VFCLVALGVILSINILGGESTVKKLLVVAALLLPFNSFAASLSGNDLLAYCPLLLSTGKISSPEDLSKAAHCAGYLGGLNDMSLLFQTVGGLKIYCLPEKGVETGQLIRVAQKWLEEHPAELHEPGRSLFISIMKDNFPCE